MPSTPDSIRVIQPEVCGRLGKIRHALFDFDGTLSVLRQGWEDVMIPFMLESICGSAPVPPEIETEVRDYVDASTGILTIKQMQWLEEAVRRYGLVDEVRSAADYKAGYVTAIVRVVRARQEQLDAGSLKPDDFLVCGARAFLSGLQQRGVSLYLASGTDHAYVLEESACLGVSQYFEGRIYGALDDTEAHDKELIIRRILLENHLSGEELLVVGDGPVEIRIARECGAIALGVASEEVERCGWNEHKVKRLIQAGADVLVADFTGELEEWLLI